LPPVPEQLPIVVFVGLSAAKSNLWSFRIGLNPRIHLFIHSMRYVE
jgi:hypothetical protein